MQIIALLAVVAGCSAILLFYHFLANSISQRSGRLHMPAPFLKNSSNILKSSVMFGRDTLHDQKAAWIEFAGKYLVVLFSLSVVMAAWLYLQPSLLQGIHNYIKLGADYYAVTSPTIPKDFVSLAGLTLAMSLTVYFIMRRSYKTTIVYPILATHLAIIFGCALSDLFNINQTLNTETFSLSVLNTVVWLVFLSHLLWALTYPRPQKMALHVAGAMVVSLFLTLCAFSFVEIVNLADSPTVTNFFIYIMFGHGVFGPHIWLIGLLCASSNPR